MDPATATRPEIREYVRVNGEALSAFAKEGGNVYQKSLDQQDEMQSLISHLDDEQRTRFLTIYTEEVNARTSMLEQDTASILAAAANAEDEQQQFGTAIAWVVAAFFLLFVLYKLST